MGTADIRFFARRAACAAGVIASLALASPAAGAPASQCQHDSYDFGSGQVCRFDPFVPLDPDGAAEKKLGAAGAPDDDLLAVLGDLETAPDEAAAARARGRALAILEGSAEPLAADDKGFLDAKAYKGMPLLNTVPKVKDGLGPDATVDIREVRFGDHAILDTSMLRFQPEAMDDEFTIRWHVTELGTSFGGELAPAWIPKDAGQGELRVAEPLVPGSLDTGTSAISRFHPAGAGEETRLVTQVVSVRMPPPAQIGAILDPNLKPGHETFAQVAVGSVDDPAPVVPAAAQIAERSPERLIHSALTALAPDDVEAAHTAGGAHKELVGKMRSRDTLPVEDGADPAADVNVQFANAEAYVSTRELRLAPDTRPDGKVRIAVTNLDGGEARTFAVRELHDRVKTVGVLDWGRFQSGVLATVTVPAGETKTVIVEPNATAYTLWLGDPAGGDQAGMAVALDRGPRTQSLELGEGGALPLHQVLDAEGNIWVTMEGTDEIVRLAPGDDRLDTRAEPARFPLPGGITADPPPGDGPAEPLLGPADIAIDGQGMIWATLTTGNAIARIDPGEAEPGNTEGKGIKIFKLAPCDRTCRTPPPPATPAPLSRFPLQMEVHEDGGGNTVVFFTEMAADRIGALRVSASGDKVLNEQHFQCACAQPLGIALDADGAIWFSEGSSNRLGRLTLGQTRPFADDAHRIDHYVIPNPVEEFVPGEPPCTPAPGQLLCAEGALPNPATTALPHSVAVDRRGRVWYTGEANERVGYLDPAKAKPNTKEGFVDAAGPVNEFGRALAPADIAFDRAGKVYFTDEYGDQIASATVGADGAIDAKWAFRPPSRNSFTDSPLVDDKGNLWFVESGSNSITRIAGVTAGLPRPSSTPLLTANTATGRVTAAGLQEMTSADVRVLRGTTLAAHEEVAVTGGGFEVTLPLRADDRVQVVPQGGANPPAAFSFRVANLTAAVGAGGALSGTALQGGKPLADSVTVDTGAGPADARIDLTEGTWSAGGSLDPATARGTVSWTAGTVSARFRTVTPFGPAGGGNGGNTGGGNTGGNTGGGAGTAKPSVPAAPTIPATPPGTTRPAPGPAETGTTDAACTTSRWLARTGSGARARRTLPLLGLSAADARRCLGRPAKIRRNGRVQRWTYTGSVELRLRSGRVTAFTLLGRGLRSAPDRAAVGTSTASFRRALGTLARVRGGYRGLVALGPDRFADVRLTVARGRVTAVTVTVRGRAALDATSRRLLRRMP
jgi:streptogramin lyase